MRPNERYGDECFKSEAMSLREVCESALVSRCEPAKPIVGIFHARVNSHTVLKSEAIPCLQTTRCEAFLKRSAATHSLSRVGNAEEVAELILYLASERAA